MPTGSLAELQRQFVATLLGQPSAGELPVEAAGAGDRAARLAVYRRNARQNFADALAVAFPLLEACMGAAEFRQMAWAYQRHCPPLAGNVLYNGARLGEFLAATVTGSPDEALVSVARLEWAIQEVLVAADSPALPDLQALAAVPADRYAELCFQLHPAVRLLATAHPVFAAWQVLQAGGVPVLPGSGAGERLLVRRADPGIELRRLDAAAWVALSAISTGAGLGTVLAGVADADPTADPGQVLPQLAALGVLNGFVLADGPAWTARQKS